VVELKETDGGCRSEKWKGPALEYPVPATFTSHVDVISLSRAQDTSNQNSVTPILCMHAKCSSPT
jgi:hypothetical protein